MKMDKHVIFLEVFLTRKPVKILSRSTTESAMVETNKQALIFNSGEDLSYFVILRYKLRDLINIYDDFVNGPVKRIFRRLC